MTTHDGGAGKEPPLLREEAESRLRRRRPAALQWAPTDIQSLVHELEVHQVELEVQNEELRRTEQALSEALAAYRDLYEHAPVAYLTLDSRGNVTRFNRTGCLLCGRERAGMIGVRLERLLHPDHRDGGWLLLQEVSATGLPATRELRLPDQGGRERWVQVEAAADRVETAGAVGGFRLALTDVSERRAAEAALRASESRLRAVLEGTALALWETDARGRMGPECQGWQTDTGLDAGQCEGVGWLCAVHPDERDQASLRWAEAVRDATVFDVEVRLHRPDGGWRWTNLRATPVRGPDGAVGGWVGMSLDVSDRRRADEAEARQRRQHELLAMLGHELRNPLTAIVSGLEVQRLLGAPEDTASVREMMARQAGYLARLVDDLLDVSRITRGKIELRRERLDLAAAVREVIAATRSRLQDRERRIVLELPAEPLAVEADPARLSQVVTNLLCNAATFTADGGEIHVGVRRDGESALVSVRDDGIGIEPDLLPRIFDLFTQGLPPGIAAQGGLGIGLTLVRNLVELHGGTVPAYSEGTGRGSLFELRLPLAGAEDAPEPAADG